jgi:hypothetical protein
MFAQFADARVNICQSGIVYKNARQDCEHIRHAAKAMVTIWLLSICNPYLTRLN